MAKVFCIHAKAGDDICLDCERDLVAGKITERRTFSRQRLYQLRRYYAGDCVNCGKKRGRSQYKRHCVVCGKKQVERIQRRIGAKAWEKGKAGRPPRESVQ